MGPTLIPIRMICASLPPLPFVTVGPVGEVGPIRSAGSPGDSMASRCCRDMAYERT